MSLEVLRATFPKTVRTEEQDMFIGASCLAITCEERKEIENLNFENYQYNSPERAKVCTRVTDAIYKAKIMGTASGAAAGALGAGVFTWKNTESAALTVLAGTGGGIAGAAAGYYAGEKIGREWIVKDITSSPEFFKWKNEKYEKIIFPALSRYMDADRWDRFKLTCPITWDFMIEPVKAGDNHIYEKTAILAHLNAWRARCPLNYQFLSEERQLEFLQGSSPLRSGYISEASLRPIPDYYKNIFKILTFNYNDKVLDQRLVVGLADRVTELSPFDDKIVKFYEKNQRERSIIAADMHTDLLRSTLSEEEIEKGREFLSAAAKLPELIKFPV